MNPIESNAHDTRDETEMHAVQAKQKGRAAQHFFAWGICSNIKDRYLIWFFLLPWIACATSTNERRFVVVSLEYSRYDVFFSYLGMICSQSLNIISSRTPNTGTYDSDQLDYFFVCTNLPIERINPRPHTAEEEMPYVTVAPSEWLTSCPLENWRLQIPSDSATLGD